MKFIPILSLAVFIIAKNIFSQVQFTSHTITFDAPNSEEMYAADVDSDGNLDILIALFVGNEVRWYENDGLGNFTEYLITSEADGPRSVYAFDVDSDGDMDVLSTSMRDDEVAWMENQISRTV